MKKVHVILIIIFSVLLVLMYFVCVWHVFKSHGFVSQFPVATEQLVMSISTLPEVKHPLIPVHARAYNPSVCLYKNKMLTAYRVSTYNHCDGKLFKHIQQYTAIHKIKNGIVIHTEGGNTVFVDYPKSYLFRCAESYEDPRVLLFNNYLLLVVNDPQQKDCICQMTILCVDVKDLDFEIVSIVVPQKTLVLRYGNTRRIEKNWMPFVYQNRLCFVYSINPHSILRCCLITGQCTHWVSTHNSHIPSYLRGGTQAVLTPDKRHYLTFAHARHMMNGIQMVYTTVGYLFEAKHPFHIVAMTDEFFIDHDFVAQKMDPLIQYPSGLLIKDDIIYLSYGVNDCYGKLAKIPYHEFQKLLNYIK